MRSENAAVSRDFPIPASPATSTTWPSPVFALDQRRTSNSASSSRPTREVSPVACIASKRLSTELTRSAAQARVGPAMPLTSLAKLGPRSCSSNRLPRSLRVPSAMTTMFGSAIPCRRAARFGVSPTMPRSCASPDPTESAKRQWHRGAYGGARRSQRPNPSSPPPSSSAGPCRRSRSRGTPPHAVRDRGSAANLRGP
jgi:hypothetical protein